MAGKRFPDSREIFCVDNKNMINSWALESGRYNAAREYEIDFYRRWILVLGGGFCHFTDL